MIRPLPFLRTAFLCAFWFTCPVAHAHDLKVLASRLTLDGSAKTTIYLGWGHLLPVDDLVDGKTIERYELIGPKGAVPLATLETSLHANSVYLEEPGHYHAIVSRKPTLLTWIIDADGNRVMKRGPKSSVKDAKIDVALRSQMLGKAILVVGKAGALPVKPAGLPLELVPLDPPAKWKAGGSLRVQVLHAGKPLAGADIWATFVGQRSDHTGHDDAPAGKTDANGVVAVPTKAAATWVLKTVVRIPASGNARDQYDFDALTSTLTLEIAR